MNERNREVSAKLWSLAGTLACLGLVGCGQKEPDYPSTILAGVVSVDGQPIPEGTISIVPTKGGQGRGAESAIVDGKYSIEKAPLGQVIVTLHAQRDTGRTYYSDQAGKELPEVESLIPSRFEMGIALNITEDMGQHDFALEKRQRFDKRRPRSNRRSRR